MHDADSPRWITSAPEETWKESVEAALAAEKGGEESLRMPWEVATVRQRLCWLAHAD